MSYKELKVEKIREIEGILESSLPEKAGFQEVII